MGGDRNTAKIADDKMPANYEMYEVLDDVVNNPMNKDNPIQVSDSSILKSNYENQGLDTSKLEVSYKGPMTRSKGKLQLDNQALNIDETITPYARSKKKSYREVKYKEAEIPEEFKEDTLEPRHSEDSKEQHGQVQDQEKH